MNKKIYELSDYPVLKKLAAALWKVDNNYHGAAVMVGAGFSRSAASTGDINRKLPLWYDLSKSIANEMGSSVNSDPLRLAEEYAAYFGKQALYDLVKSHVNDAAWCPGTLHSLLLELPWSEVLTTNWDTLLERAALEVHHPVYSLVAKQEDLSSARSPRIVKLHGTVNVSEDLVFTQEDYRRYTERYAAFVNFARQVFIENELCLVGFSGDDPNFLQWAGWVRDQLATNARRIYIVGALGLSAAKRKYLESINIAPIDLGDLVHDYDSHDVRHSVATEMFLNALHELKPKQAWDWSPTSLYQIGASAEELDKAARDPDSAALILARQIPLLQSDRESYPGWVVCPPIKSWELQTQISTPFPSPRNLAGMEEKERVKMVYEMGWRHGITYEVPSAWLVSALLDICAEDPQKKILSQKQQAQLTLLLAKNSRWLDDSFVAPIENLGLKLLQSSNPELSGFVEEITYFQAITARDQFDYKTLESLVDKISPSDSTWKIRKASLLAELGRFEDGEILISEAYRELRSHYRNDPTSVYIVSRLAWVHWLMRAIRTLRSKEDSTDLRLDYREFKCDPWDQIEHLQKRIAKALEQQKKQKGIELLFEPGTYRDKSSSVTYSNEIHPLLLLEGVTASVGLPLRWHGINFLVEQASMLAELDGLDDSHRFSLVIRAAHNDTSDVLKHFFSRTRIACLSQVEAERLLNRCMEAIDYWEVRSAHANAKTRDYALERLQIFIEVLARVSVRAVPELAKKIFRKVCGLIAKPQFQHLWLFDSLRHLTSYSLGSIPESQHPEILFDALSVPLQSEISSMPHLEWPNPVINNPGVRLKNPALDRRIDEIIDSVTASSAQRRRGLLRLLPLCRAGYLTSSEASKLTERIWGNTPDYTILPETELFSYVFLDLPSQHPEAVKSAVNNYLFSATPEVLFDATMLRDIAAAGQGKTRKLFPTRERAEDYFEKMVHWRPTRDIDVGFKFSGRSDKQIGDLIGKALSQTVVPSLPVDSFTENNFAKLCAFYSEVGTPEVIIAFSYFAAANEVFSERVERFIRQGLQERVAHKVASASRALLKWREMQESPATARLGLRLIYAIGSNRMAGLSALLWTAREMFSSGFLSKSDVESLAEILPIIFDNADYQRTSASDEDAVSASLVRAECVRLSRAISDDREVEEPELMRILVEALQDPLPEVRFSLDVRSQ